MDVQLITVLVSVLLCGTLIRPILGACPSESEITNVFAACIPQFNGLTEFSKGPVTASQLNNYCNSTTRSTEIKCVEDLVNECKQQSDKARRIIEKTFNINGIKTAVNLLCDNAKLFVGKQECIARYESTVTACVEKGSNTLDGKLASLQREARAKGESQDWFVEKTFEALCQFNTETSDCHSPYRQNCGDKVGDIFDALDLALTPPACAGVMEQASFILLIFLAVFTVIKGSQ